MIETTPKTAEALRLEVKEIADIMVNERLEKAAVFFEKMHSDGPLAEFNGNFVASKLREMKNENL